MFNSSTNIFTAESNQPTNVYARRNIVLFHPSDPFVFTVTEKVVTLSNLILLLYYGLMPLLLLLH